MKMFERGIQHMLKFSMHVEMVQHSFSTFFQHISIFNMVLNVVNVNIFNTVCVMNVVGSSYSSEQNYICSIILTYCPYQYYQFFL